jgi:hypothetical protein
MLIRHQRTGGTGPRRPEDGMLIRPGNADRVFEAAGWPCMHIGISGLPLGARGQEGYLPTLEGVWTSREFRRFCRDKGRAAHAHCGR